MNEQELANELNKWFAAAQKSNKNFWNRNPVARVMKENLLDWKHWKNKGTPRFRNKY